MKRRLKHLIIKCKDYLKSRSREFYMGLGSLIILLVSVYALIVVFVSFDNKEYDESENLFFSGVIIEPTVFNDYRDKVENLNYDSISKERRDFIELYKLSGSLSHIDSIIATLKSYKYNHGNKEDEIISIVSNYIVTDTSITYSATFRLNEFINEKNHSTFDRKIYFVFRTPHNKDGIFVKNDMLNGVENRKILNSKEIDYVSAFQLFEVENKEAMPESRKANDVYRVYETNPSNFPFTINYTVNKIPRNSYFDNTEIDLINITDSKGEQVFTIKNNVIYNDKVDVLNIEPIENIVTQNNLNKDVVLENLPYKHISMDGQKLSLDIWDSLDRFTFPVNQNESSIYLKYKTNDLELQRELYSVILSILIGAALSGFLSAVLNIKSSK